MKRQLAMIAWAVTAACAPDVPSAELLAVTPPQGTMETTTPIVITGRGLDGLADVRYDAMSIDVKTTHEARLGTYALDAVELLSSRELHARVPAGLPLGVYDLLVVRPTGQGIALADAFTVIGTPDGCSGAALRVRTHEELSAAVESARGASAVTTICIAASIAPTEIIEIDPPGVRFETTADGELSGANLPADEVGLAFQGGTSSIEGVRFSDYEAEAVRVDLGELELTGARFDRCESAIRVVTGASSVAIRGSLFVNGTFGVQADRTGALTIDNNTFYGMANPILTERVPLALRNNYFEASGNDALTLAVTTQSAPAQANIFTPARSCNGTGCADLDASNQVLDCVLRDPASGDYGLSEGSPCIDLGVDVGRGFEGLAPDIGAFEAR